MKRILSLILAALLATSALVACEPTPAETQTNETNTPATDAVATEAIETGDPATTTALITENGVAKAHIVLAESATDTEKSAAEELAAHIKLVSGAEVAVVQAAMDDSLPIMIGTPESMPELETLFADDLTWLRDLGDGENVRWGSDGFAIRQLDGTLYIFGVTPRGALNGVYDFIEDNMGVLWVRADESYGTIYDEMPTISLTAVDYREKSPFEIRGWTLASESKETSVLFSRNKLNALAEHPFRFDQSLGMYEDLINWTIGSNLEIFVSGENIVWWVQNSPSYDPENAGYWATPTDGAYPSGHPLQVNIWSDLTVQCIADSIVALLDEYKESAGIRFVGVDVMDTVNTITFTEMKEPYEYAPGQFIEPTAQNYISTVYFSFVSKIAALVEEKYPDIMLHAYAYGSTTTSNFWTTNKAPAMETLPDNLYVTLCPIDEDLCAANGESPNYEANKGYASMLAWMEITPNIQVYNYYGCFTAGAFYSRPIWYRIQDDLQLYAANGFNGLIPEGVGECGDAEYCAAAGYKFTSELRAPYLTMGNNWTMNAMTYWIYSKLAWNPNEDVDALIAYYCDKVYGEGEASEQMQEYYRLLTLGWEDGRATMADEFGTHYYWRSTPDIYWNYFLDVEVDGVHIVSAMTEAIDKAYDAADEKGKTYISYMKEIYDNAEALFTD